MTLDNGSITWKWLAVTLVSIMILGGVGWMTWVSTRVGAVEVAQATDSRERGKIEADIKVLDERVRRTQEDVKDVKEIQKEQNKKLDEIKELIKQRGR